MKPASKHALEPGMSVIIFCQQPTGAGLGRRHFKFLLDQHRHDYLLNRLLIHAEYDICPKRLDKRHLSDQAGVWLRRPILLQN